MDLASKGYLQAERLAYLSLWTLALLGLVEIGGGWFTGSIGLTADGVDSMSDALISFLVWLGLKISRREADERFHFGYYKAESFVSFVGGVALVGIGAAVFYRSFLALLDPRPLTLPALALVLLIVAGTVSLYRALQMRQVARRYNIISLKLDASNAIKDSLSSYLVFFTVSASSLGFYQMDAVGGMAVAIFISIIALVALKESSLVLLDAYHNPALIEEIRGIAEANEGVRVEDILLRPAGPYIDSEMHIEVEDSMTVGQLDRIKTSIEGRVRLKFDGVRRVVISARARRNQPSRTNIRDTQVVS